MCILLFIKGVALFRTLSLTEMVPANGVTPAPTDPGFFPNYLLTHSNTDILLHPAMISQQSRMAAFFQSLSQISPSAYFIKKVAGFFAKDLVGCLMGASLNGNTETMAIVPVSVSLFLYNKYANTNSCSRGGFLYNNISMKLI